MSADQIDALMESVRQFLADESEANAEAFFSGLEVLLEVRNERPDLIPADLASDLTHWALTVAGEGTARLRDARQSTDLIAELGDSIGLLSLAIAVLPAGHPDRWRYKLNLCQALTNRGVVAGQEDDLREACQVIATAIAAAPPDDPDLPRHIEFMSLVYATRFSQGGGIEDLEDARVRLRSAVDMLPTQYPTEMRVWATLASSAIDRFNNVGDVTALDLGIALEQDSIAVSHGERAELCASLGGMLFTRFRLTRSLGHLKQSLDAFSEAAHSLTSASNELSWAWAGLATCQLCSYTEMGEAELLRASIESADQAIRTATTTIDMAGGLAAKSKALISRFDLEGSRPDIDGAIDGLEEAIRILPAGHADSSVYLSNLGSALLERFKVTTTKSDIERSISAQRSAANASAQGSPDQGLHFANLGTAYRVRFEHAEVESDLLESVEAHHAAVSATPVAHPSRALRVVGLGTAYFSMFRSSGNLRQLDEAIDLLRRGTEPMASHLPSRSGFLITLARALEQRFRRTHVEADLDQAKAILREVAFQNGGDTYAACEAAIRLAGVEGGDGVAAAYARAVDLLHRSVPYWVSDEDALQRIRNLSWIGREATAVLLDQGNVEGALRIGERARAVVFSLRLRATAEVRRLRIEMPELGERLVVAMRRVRHERANPAAPDDLLGHAVRSQEGWTASSSLSVVDAIVAEVRSCAGWSHFLLPPYDDGFEMNSVDGSVVVLNVASNRSDALILRGGVAEHVPLPCLNETEAEWQTNRFLHATHSRSTTASELGFDPDAHQQEVLAWLWDVAIEPVLDYLGHRTRPDKDFRSWPRVWWIATGALALLPVHAAGHHFGKSESLEASAAERTVIDRVVSSTVPTIRSLLDSANRPPAARADDARVVLVAMPTTVQASPLPGALDESELCGNELRRNGANVLLLTSGVESERSPSRDRVVQELNRSVWAHFACHGVYDRDDPWRSRLLLADHALNPLTVSDFGSLDLVGSEHLFLSACTTAMTGIATLNEPVQFAAAGFLAGFRHVIGTLWQILDDPRPAVLYYRRLGAVGDWTAPGAAFALHEVLHEQRRRFPSSVHRWGPYVHFGP